MIEYRGGSCICEGQRIIQRLRRDIFSSLIKSDVAFFDQAKTGELLNRLANDTQVVGSSLTYNISDGLRSSLQVIGGVSLMVRTLVFWSLRNLYSLLSCRCILPLN